MQISREIVKHTAYLARLSLSKEELELYSHQLAKVLEYIEKLKELDVKDVPPTSHVLNLKNVFRKDEVKPSLPLEEVLKNAPERKDNFFSVPKVF
jgi:aspartyl-tRNA(Asn)/glutamyl-tRNA(Gln) amidotransferase subunit C